jgi:hypothetical protein
VEQQQLIFLNIILHLGDILQVVINNPKLLVAKLVVLKIGSVDYGDIPPRQTH